MNTNIDHIPSLKEMLTHQSTHAHKHIKNDAKLFNSTHLTPPLLTKSVHNKKTTAPNLHLWRAVALQQHAIASGTLNINARNNNNLNINDCSNKLTLAQKLGLVSRPPSPPTDNEWRETEEVALRRTDNELSSRCSICCQPFYATCNQGQVLLSCSHVFHERCFTQFEKFVQRQRRNDANLFIFASRNNNNNNNNSTISSNNNIIINNRNYVSTTHNVGEVYNNVTDMELPIRVRLACPVCRSVHYHKRIFYAGKVAAQRAAIVRIQAFVRGFCARRRYLRCRLQHSSNFRQQYVQSHLARLSEAWDNFLSRRETQRDAELAQLDARRDVALGVYLLEEDWQRLIAESLFLKTKGDAMTIHDSRVDVADVKDFSSSECCINDEASSCVKGENEHACKVECVICLEVIECKVHLLKLQKECLSDNVNPEEQPSAQDGNTTKKIELARDSHLIAKGRTKQASLTLPVKQKEDSRSNVHNEQNTLRKPDDRQTGKEERQVYKRKQNELHHTDHDNAFCNDTHAGVILSCGHCFHVACLNTFELYMTGDIVPDNIANIDVLTSEENNSNSRKPIPRCPLCRRGYVKHPLEEQTNSTQKKS